VTYFIRESYKDGGCYRCRDLFDLGRNPTQYIIYPGGNAYYVDEVVEDSIASSGGKVNPWDVEDLFWPFVDPRLRHILSWTRERAKGNRERRRLGAEEESRIRVGVNEFDKRRAHYLKYGSVDQGSIGRMPVKLYQWAFEKSRDEIEQQFMKMEWALESSELKSYTYVIFDLQRFFTESWAKKIPQGLDQDKMDRHFLEEICRLNRDASFWGGEEPGKDLHDYLVRYLIMFFDHGFGPDSFWQDYIREFIDARRAWSFPRRKSTMSLKEAGSIFGVAEDVLRTMNRRSIVRLFRRKAKKLHPDMGGTKEAFVQLSEAYEELLRRKRDGS
jgi:hypothetical protein